MVRGCVCAMYGMHALREMCDMRERRKLRVHGRECTWFELPLEEDIRIRPAPALISGLLYPAAREIVSLDMEKEQVIWAGGQPEP